MWLDRRVLEHNANAQIPTRSVGVDYGKRVFDVELAIGEIAIVAEVGNDAAKHSRTNARSPTHRGSLVGSDEIILNQVAKTLLGGDSKDGTCIEPQACKTT